MREVGDSVQWFWIMQAFDHSGTQVPTSDAFVFMFVLVCLLPQLNDEFKRQRISCIINPQTAQCHASLDMLVNGVTKVFQFLQKKQKQTPVENIFEAFCLNCFLNWKNYYFMYI